MNTALIRSLKSQSTWRLLGLGLITYFIYPAHYIKRQTAILNEHCESDKRIPDALVTSILVLAYLALPLFVAYFFVDESNPIVNLGTLVDRSGSLLMLIWGFKARNRMNEILALEKGSPRWFHGLWTFLFSPLYFNFKVNQLNEELGPKENDLPLPLPG